MSWCADCNHLDKKRRQYSEQLPFWRYGCNARGADVGGGGYICGWVHKDSDLKWMGCSRFAKREKPHQIGLAEL